MAAEIRPCDACSKVAVWWQREPHHGLRYMFCNEHFRKRVEAGLSDSAGYVLIPLAAAAEGATEFVRVAGANIGESSRPVQRVNRPEGATDGG